ncbi:MAG: DNA polymerase III subunit delta' [Deltaproteobacteria bacterium]|nr:DNA polymerase III subunit delta' [Deltaproteobacteria bacterium]
MWQTIHGHDRQIAQLQQAIAQGTLAPTALFAGPPGVGKFRVALTLAQQLFCQRGRATPPCGVCSSCMRIEHGTHPDVLSLAPEPDKTVPDIPIATIRQMQSRLLLHPLEGECRLAIIDSAEAMQPAAANACLKIFEEPPAAAYFILITSQPHRLLPTIRSRAQTITFGPLPQATIRQHLMAEGIDPAEARQRAGICEGSLGAALAYPAEAVAETLQDLHQLLGDRATSQPTEVARRWAADGTLLPWRLQLIGLVWRDALGRTVAGVIDTSLAATESLVSRLAGRTARRLSQELVLILAHIDAQGETPLNKQLSCETLLFRLVEA